jgi:hypothetical protein
MPRLRTALPDSFAMRLLASMACSLALLCVANVGGALGATHGQSGLAAAAVAPQEESATLEQCVTSVVQAERAATFFGEMTAITGTARMAMRIDLQQRMPGDVSFHTVSASGLGVWQRDSAAKVKVWKSIQTVTNLSAPAVYRALVRFRWLNAKGHVIKHEERLTSKCAQPAAPPSEAQGTPQRSSSSASTPATG